MTARRVSTSTQRRSSVEGVEAVRTRKARANYESRRQADRERGIVYLLDNTGALRRLQALVALGWSQAELGRRLGYADCKGVSGINELMRSRQKIRRGTFARIVALYDELSMRLPPETTQYEKAVAVRARNKAARRGWAPPLAWDEETIDDPAARPRLGPKKGSSYDHAVVLRLVDGGERLRKLRHDEAEAAFRILRARGHTTWEIEHHYGLNAERYGHVGGQERVS